MLATPAGAQDAGPPSADLSADAGAPPPVQDAGAQDAGTDATSSANWADAASPYEPSELPYDEASIAVGAEETVVAAGATGAGPGSGDVMVVTAQFREQNPQQTPLAITVVSAETMQARSQVSIADLANQAPNVKLSPAAGAFGPGLQAHIRGVGQHDFNFALEPGVGIYVDDVYFSTLTGSVLDLLDLERVEILRGPQGTLAGQNSIGGALKLYSKKPQGGNTGFVQTTYGRYNRTEARGAADFTLVDDKLFGRISGVANHQDGYVTRYDYACTHPGTTVGTYQNSDNCKLGTEGGRAYAGLRTSLRWIPTDRIEVNLSGDYTKDNSEATPNTLLYVGHVGNPMTMTPPGPGLPANANPQNTTLGGIPLGTPEGSQFISYSPFGNFAQDTFSNSPYVNYSTYTNPAPLDGSPPYSIPPTYQVSGGGASGKIELELSEALRLTSITAYREYNGYWAVEEGTPIGTAMLRNVVSNRQATEEVRLGGRLFGDRVDYTLGGFYLWRESHYSGRIDLRPTQFIEDDKIPATTAAGFANLEWHITDDLDLVGGGRYTWQTKKFHYGRRFVPGVVVDDGNPDTTTPREQIAALDGEVGKFTGDRWDYRGVLQYQWIPQLMTYGQVSTGFKGGGVNPRPFDATQIRSHKPETLLAYEVGAKSDWFDSRLRFNAAAFYNQYKDILMTATRMCPEGSTPIPCFMPINAGEAHVMGFELESLIFPYKGIGLDGSLSYLKFKYDSISSVGTSSGITKDMTGPFAPKWKASGGVRYVVLMGSAGSVTPRLDLIYQSSFQTNPVNSPLDLVGDRLLLNARLTWASADDTWQAALELTNLTNRLYYYNVRDDRSSSLTVTGQPAPPRQWAVTLKRTFF